MTVGHTVAGPHRPNKRDRAFQCHGGPQTHVAALRNGSLPVNRDTGSNHVEGQIGTGHGGRRITQVRDLTAQALVAGLRQHVVQPLCLKVVDGVTGVVAVHQVRHDAAQPDRVVGLRAS